jgi:transcriptional regulator with XRE-family HTH domain
MTPEQAKRFGRYLHRHRMAKSLSIRDLAELVGVNSGTITRLELGEIQAPAPDKLAAIAEALGLKLADVYAMAHYAVPRELPSMRPYLRSKYRALPASAADQLEAYAERLMKRHGVDLSGPAPGEDEQLEPSTKRTRAKKGGTK